MTGAVDSILSLCSIGHFFTTAFPFCIPPPPPRARVQASLFLSAHLLFRCKISLGLLTWLSWPDEVLFTSRNHVTPIIGTCRVFPRFFCQSHISWQATKALPKPEWQSKVSLPVGSGWSWVVERIERSYQCESRGKKGSWEVTWP